MEPASAQSTLDVVLGYIREELRARSGRFLDRAERALARHWTQVQDLHERSLMQEAARWLTANKPAIHARLHRHFGDALSARPASSTPDHSSLRVLDTGELAITLARDQMISKVMREGRSELAALEARFEILARDGAYANPKALWPGAIADSFITVLKSLNVPGPIQRMLLDSYGDEGIKLLIEFYRGINALLVRNNVGRGVSDPFATSDRAELLRIGDRSVFALARGVRLVLGRLQQGMAGVDLKTWKPGTLRELIGSQFVESAGPRGALSRAQSQSIDHVESLLLDWLRDVRISARVRDEIRRLTLPILVGRLICGDEFAAADNPIRVFLRQLAVIGYRDQEFPLSTYDSVRLIVDRIVAEQGGESASFRSAADALNTLSRHEVRRRLAAHPPERPVKPIADDSRAAMAVREAHRQVTAELTEHAAGLVLPEEVKQFVLHLLGPWMMVRYQRYGHDSTPYRQAREFAASFFEGLRPAVSTYDAERKREHRARILHQARTRTERSSVSQQRMSELLAALERHLSNLDHLDASTEALEPPRVRAGDNFLDGLQPIAAA